jgi:hypothetical protein
MLNHPWEDRLMKTTLLWMIPLLSACTEESQVELPPSTETEAVTPAPEADVVAGGSRRAGYDETLPPGQGWTRSARGPLVPPRDGSPHGPAPEPTLQADAMMCSTYSCWDPAFQPAGAEAGVRNYINAADVAVIGEFVGTTEVYGPGRAAKARAVTAAGRWAGTPPPDETLGRHSARRIRVIHRAKGPDSEEILLMGGRAGWTEGQRIILFGLAGDPTDEFPETLYYDKGEMFDGLCVRSGVPMREGLESCQGRFKVPWDELESIVVAQSVSDTTTADEVLR